MGLNLDEQKAVERFQKDVVEPSMSKLVVLDFWAEWCGPCKALTPVLEKVTAEYADKGVVLKKLNVDEEQFIASQFQVQSIPTVYALFQGRPVADLTSARSESQLRDVLDQILAQLPIGEGGGEQPQQDVGQFIEMAEGVLAEGEHERALGIFAQVIDMAPDNAAAHAGLVRAMVAMGETERAREHLTSLDPTLAEAPEIKQARTAIELAGDKVDDSELANLREKAQGGDMDARYAYAEAAFAAGQRDAAADELLAMVETDREWNEGAARTKLLQIFEAVGLEDPWVVATRRRLSKILFG